MQHYILIDLERSIKTGRTFYWGPNQRGYTTDLEEAGCYGQYKAIELVNQDIDRRTVSMEREQALKLWRGQL